MGAHTILDRGLTQLMLFLAAADIVDTILAGAQAVDTILRCYF